MGQSSSRKHGQDAPSPVSEISVNDQIHGAIFGQCIGDAIGLLTEFMTKEEAHKYYGKKISEGLEYSDKVPDFHRSRWEEGDWTDDSDQMLAIMQSLLDNDGKVLPVDFGQKLVKWMKQGIPEFGDLGGMGIGGTTKKVLGHPEYGIDPHKCAFEVWDSSQRRLAPNGAVMRTSLLGIHDFKSLEKVIDNAVNICKTTHADPRCVASCVAVVTAISTMLNRKENFLDSRNCFHIEAITRFSFEQAAKFIDDEGHKEELRAAMFPKSLKSLEFASAGSIGYTFKALGAGFWALQQNDFRYCLTKILMEGGDADTNGAVAGAMLGCKIGKSKLPTSWVDGLKHKEWLENKMQRYMDLLVAMETLPVEN